MREVKDIQPSGRNQCIKFIVFAGTGVIETSRRAFGVLAATLAVVPRCQVGCLVVLVHSMPTTMRLNLGYIAPYHYCIILHSAQGDT